MHSCVYISMHQTTVCAVARPRCQKARTKGTFNKRCQPRGGKGEDGRGGVACSAHRMAAKHARFMHAVGTCQVHMLQQSGRVIYKRVDNIDGNRRGKEQVHVQCNS